MSAPTLPPRERSMLAAIGLALLVTGVCLFVATILLNIVAFLH